MVLSDSSRISITLERRDGGDPRVYLVARPKHYTARHAPITMQCRDGKNGTTLVLNSSAVHTAIYLPPGLLEEQADNFRTLLPGKELRIRVKGCPEPDQVRSFPGADVIRSE